MGAPAPTSSGQLRTAQVSKQLSSDEKWDHSIENALRKTSIGFVAGLLPSLIVARSSVARCGIVFFTTGLAAGVAYGEARYLFDHNIAFDRRHVVNVEFFKKQ
jgi:MICOS complex subunit MIC10